MVRRSTAYKCTVQRKKGTRYFCKDSETKDLDPSYKPPFVVRIWKEKEQHLKPPELLWAFSNTPSEAVSSPCPEELLQSVTSVSAWSPAKPIACCCNSHSPFPLLYEDRTAIKRGFSKSASPSFHSPEAPQHYEHTLKETWGFSEFGCTKHLFARE